MIKAYLASDPARYMAISCGALLAGMLFYGFYNKLIIIRLPQRTYDARYDRRAFRRSTRLTYYNGERLIDEDRELIYSADLQTTMQDLVAAWLTLLDEERLLSKKVGVQSVILDPHKNTAFISFTTNPFTRKQSTYEKLMFIEGLLRSLRASNIPLKKVQLLAGHTPIIDDHLDFSHAWTVQGYLA